jgi:hypothetical protein
MQDSLLTRSSFSFTRFLSAVIAGLKLVHTMRDVSQEYFTVRFAKMRQGYIVLTNTPLVCREKSCT